MYGVHDLFNESRVSTIDKMLSRASNQTRTDNNRCPDKTSHEAHSH